MKTQLLLLLLSVLSFIGYSQQNSITQPAMVNSNQKLDSIYVYSQPIIKSNTDLEGKTEKLIIKAYDTDKNPTSVMQYYYQDAYNDIVADSLKVTMQHYNYTDFTTDYRHSLHGNISYISGFETPRFYYLFNLKSVAEEIVNTNTNEWIPSYNGKQLSDLRYPNATNFITTKYDYDSNFNLINVYKTDGVVELNGLGYYNEVTFYNWNTTDGFIPNYKYVYYNTYDANNKLTESIIKKIDDISSGIEVNYSKFTINYGTDLFQIIFSNWDDATNNWALTNKREINYSNGDPVISVDYYWDAEWIVEDSEGTTTNYYFNNNKYKGFTYSDPFNAEAYEISYDTDDLISYEFYNYSDDQDHGDFYEKEYYYSSDSGINGISENTLNNILFYPNPIKNYIRMDLPEKVEFQIYTIDGKTVLIGNTENTINISNLTNGVYFLKIKNSINSSVKKIIINN